MERNQPYFDNINPAKGETYSLIPDSDERDIEITTAAFQSWSNMAVAKRSDIFFFNPIRELLNQAGVNRIKFSNNIL